MGYLIILFGLMIVAVAAVMFVRPAIFVDRMRQLSGPASLQFVAVIVRLILGFALVTYAGQSRFPLALQIIGVISIAAAVIIAAIPRSRFERLITWVLNRFEHRARVGALVALLFGAFLIYAVF